MSRSSVSAILACVAFLAAPAFGELPVSDTPDLVWSNDKSATTPENDTTFHGEFSNEGVTAGLDKLPPHDFLQISVQLLILRSWDGLARSNGGNRMGPDFFRMGLEDGPDGGGSRTLVHACFSNTPVMSGFSPAGNFQTYPSPVPGDRVPYMTGSDFKNTFGYKFPSGGPPITVPQDALYTLKMTVPHTAEKATLQFCGMGLQNISDESWGVMNIKMTTRTKDQFRVNIGDKDLYDTFTDGDGHEYKMLAVPSFSTLLQSATGHDPIAANDAFWKLVAGADATAAFLARTIKPIAVDRDKITALAAPLYEDAAPTDEKDPRIQALLKYGIAAEPVIRDARIDRNETPSRLDWALIETGVVTVDDPDLRQWIVATRILEAIGTPDARKARAMLMGTSPK